MTSQETESKRAFFNEERGVKTIVHRPGTRPNRATRLRWPSRSLSSILSFRYLRNKGSPQFSLLNRTRTTRPSSSAAVEYFKNLDALCLRMALAGPLTQDVHHAVRGRTLRLSDQADEHKQPRHATRADHCTQMAVCASLYTLCTDCTCAAWTGSSWWPTCISRRRW